MNIQIIDRDSNSTEIKDTNADVNIIWQRLLVEGETCPRCGLTERSVEESALQLEKVLLPLGKTVSLQKREMKLEDFGDEVYRQSNEIIINGKTLEEWLGGEIGVSQCEGVCGDNDCRTLELDGEVYEAVPVDVIVRAGMMAAATQKTIKENVTQPSCGCGCDC